MSDMDKTGRLLGWGIATALLCLAAIAQAAAEPSPLPELKPVAERWWLQHLRPSQNGQYQASMVPKSLPRSCRLRFAVRLPIKNVSLPSGHTHCNPISPLSIYRY
jgi:hypothetical protein